jgi:hypothetical protein
MNKLKKQLYKFKDNFSWTCAPIQSSRTSRFTIQTVELNSCKVEVNRRTATYIEPHLQSITTSHIGEALGHKSNSLNILKTLPQWIFMVCKTLAFFRIYLANRSSLSWPEKLRISHVLSCNEKHCGTNIGSTQFSRTPFIILVPGPY